MSSLKLFAKIPALARQIGRQVINAEHGALAMGKLLSDAVKAKQGPQLLGNVEFKVFSQFGDDGIIQWLTHNLDFPEKTFTEFGVADYRESNTRFLMMNDNWSGIVLDGSPRNVARIQSAEYFWQHELTAKAAFIDISNVNELISTPVLGKQLGILHIDLDGNDYWIWKTVAISPIMVILEYNSVFGIDRSISIPYEPLFYRSKAHCSNLYYGASLPALYELSLSKGYAFVGCNSAGNNAYFVRRDKLNDTVVERSLADGYVRSKFRESRAEDGRLTFLSGAGRLDAIRGLPVYNTKTGLVEAL